MAPISSSAKKTMGNAIRFGSWMVTTSPRLMPMLAQERGAALDLVLQLAVGDAALAVDEHLALGMARRAARARMSKKVSSLHRPRLR